MASIERRPTRSGEDRYRVVWWEQGRRQQLTWRTLDEADRFRQRVEGNGNQWPPGENPAEHRRPDGLTFGEWATTAIEHRSRASERTREDYRRDLATHFAALNDVPLSALTASHVIAWMRDRETAGLAEKTRRNLHGFASSVVADAMSQHPPLIDHNPFADRLTERAAIRTEEMVFLEPTQFDQVLRHVPDERSYRELVRLLFGTGLRYGEATALQVGDINLFGARRTLTVTKAWKRTGTSGYVVGEPKTRRSRRTISLSDELVDMLIPLVASRRAAELLFPGAAGDRLPHTEVYKRAWAPAVSRANVCDNHYAGQRDGRGNPPTRPDPCDCPTVLGKVPRIHDLRHSHISMLIAAGIPIAAISKRVGHASVQVTIDRYGHLDSSLDAQVDAAVDRALTRRDRDPERVD